MRTLATNGIPDLAEKIFLNKDVPENRNVKLKRQHYPATMKVYKNNSQGVPAWQDQTLKPVIAKMINKSLNVILKYILGAYENEEDTPVLPITDDTWA